MSSYNENQNLLLLPTNLLFFRKFSVKKIIVVYSKYLCVAKSINFNGQYEKNLSCHKNVS